MKQLDRINKNTIISLWNSIADIRFQQIISGEDDSFNNVLLPNMLSQLSPEKYDAILDIGCGNGLFTNKLISCANTITGIDISERNIEIARKNRSNNKIIFTLADAETFSSNSKFDCIVSNMVLMDAMNIEQIIYNISLLIREHGDFIISLTHPCYWPIYWNYYKEDWFDYSKELIIENNFRIGNTSVEQKTIHFHRPLELYIALLKKYSFNIQVIKELRGKNFNLPRFLIIKCRKGETNE